MLLHSMLLSLSPNLQTRWSLCMRSDAGYPANTCSSGSDSTSESFLQIGSERVFKMVGASSSGKAAMAGCRRCGFPFALGLGICSRFICTRIDYQALAASSTRTSPALGNRATCFVNLHLPESSGSIERSRESQQHVKRASFSTQV